jgi:hypothetical protein
MKTRAWKIEDGGWMARSVLECGGKWSATPLSDVTGTMEKLHRRCALPEQSKTWRLKLLLCLILLPLAFSLQVWGQSYSIDWYKIAAGGGTSTNGAYSVSGTIGQPDAGAAMTGGNYSVTGGFWSLISVVQTLGAPTLAISHAGNGVIISWPSSSPGWKLQQNINSLNPADWRDVTDTIQDDGTTKTLTVNPPDGNRFYRLFKP